jgi:hypothetical protein
MHPILDTVNNNATIDISTTAVAGIKLTNKKYTKYANLFINNFIIILM